MGTPAPAIVGTSLTNGALPPVEVAVLSVVANDDDEVLASVVPAVLSPVVVASLVAAEESPVVVASPVDSAVVSALVAVLPESEDSVVCVAVDRSGTSVITCAVTKGVVKRTSSKSANNRLGVRAIAAM